MKYVTLLSVVLTLGLTLTAQDPASVDASGDPLPVGAVARLGTLRMRHDAAITCQAVANDGKLIATGGGRTVRVWDAVTGRQLYALTINQNGRAVAPSAVCFSPDGKLLGAMGAYGMGMLTIWDLRGGQARQELQLPQREDYSNTLMDAPFLALLSNNKQALVKNYSDRTIRLIDLENGQELKSFQDGSTALNCIALSPDTRWLAAGTENRQVIVWDLQKGNEATRLSHDYPLVCLAFSPDSQQLATLDQDLSPKVWNLATGKVQLSLPAKTRSSGISWGLDGKSLLVARQPDQILRWNLADTSEKTYALPRGWVNGPLLSCLSKDHGETLLLGSLGRRGNNFAKLRRIDLDHLEASQQFDGYDNGSIFPMYLGHRQQWASIGSTGDDILRYWDARGKVSSAIKLPITEQSLRSYSVGPQGKLAALSCTDGRILVIDTATGKLIHLIRAFNRACYDTEFTADGEALIATDLRTVKVFQMSTGAESKSYDLQTTDPARTVISPDGFRIASMMYVPEDEQMQLRIIEARSGKVLSGESRLPVQQQNFYYSPDGRNVIMLANRGRNTGGISIVEAASGKTRFQTELPASYPYLGSHARISPDGKWLVVPASGNDTEQYAALLWRLGEKKEPIVLAGHRGAVLTANFSSDSKQLVTVSADTTMVVWDMQRLADATLPALDDKAFEKLWQDLGDQDTQRSFAAVHRLSREPNAAKWIVRQIVEKSIIINPELIKGWISQLNAVKFSDREEASKQLIRHAMMARNQIKAAIEQADSAEAKRRLEQILEQARGGTGLANNPLQYSRAMEALELMGSLEALQQLSQRKDSLGQEARESVLRLRLRNVTK